MNVLITAGGTAERIDEVREITNRATGRLGSLIAELFSENPGTEVTYICSNDAVKPAGNRVEVRLANTAAALLETVETLMSERQFDAVIHSMAVSDYSLQYSLSADELADSLAQAIAADQQPASDDLSKQIHAALIQYESQKQSKKLSSGIEHLFLCLKKTPKIIELFKRIQPNTILVGFKLLVDTSERELLEAARGILTDNHCDFVLANDQRSIAGDQHQAFLIGQGGLIGSFETKSEIAHAIRDNVTKKYQEKNGVKNEKHCFGCHR